MPGTLHVWPEEPRTVDGEVVVAAQVESDAATSDRFFFRVPGRWAGRIGDVGNAFLIGSLFAAMRGGETLHLHGRVSARLMRSLEDFQAIWQRWRPDTYSAVDLIADAENALPARDAGSACLAFSGGVDSSFTAWRHVRGLCGRRTRKLEAAVMVHGFDIPLAQAEAFERAASNARRMVSDLGLELVPVASNARRWVDDWEDGHGAAIAAALHLVAGPSSEGLVASSHAYEALRLPWGSNPLSDPLLSSESFSIVYDAGEVPRWEKVAGVAAWPMGREHLRVCWEGAHKDRNCGRCARCSFTALCFAAVGAPPPGCLAVGDLVEAARRLCRFELGPEQLRRIAEFCEFARSRGVQAEWLDILESRRAGAAPSRRHAAGRGGLLDRFRRARR